MGAPDFWGKQESAQETVREVKQLKNWLDPYDALVARVAGARDLAEMLDAAGFKDVRPDDGMNPPGHCIHEMGGARMSRTAQTGVLNGWNQAWDVKNLFVTDGSCMASTACQNPSITYMALTARAAAHAVAALKRNEL